MCEEYGNERFQPVLTTKGSEMIVQYDEHRLTNNFKFGIIYQTFKQVGHILDYKDKISYILTLFELAPFSR